MIDQSAHGPRCVKFAYLHIAAYACLAETDYQK